MLRLSLVLTLTVSCPAPLLLRLARAVTRLFSPTAITACELAPSATSSLQCMMLAPIVILLGDPLCWLRRSVTSALPPLAASPRDVIMPPERMTLTLSMAEMRSSTLTPSAVDPPTLLQLTPAMVLFLSPLARMLFHRVSARAVYAMSFPTVCASAPAVVTRRSMWYMDISFSSTRLKSFLSLESWPETCALALRRPSRERGSTSCFSMENPSMPSSWSYPCASTMGRTIHMLALSRKR
mmetsp:Transcript_61271/g.194059  ORF Transcript_61271/g.194059 Transcript_61271/m.194059 type:complete len:239 (+) Transcript_61271:93-809(+)